MRAYVASMYLSSYGVHAPHTIDLQLKNILSDFILFHITKLSDTYIVFNSLSSANISVILVTLLVSNCPRSNSCKLLQFENIPDIFFTLLVSISHKFIDCNLSIFANILLLSSGNLSIFHFVYMYIIHFSYQACTSHCDCHNSTILGDLLGMAHVRSIQFIQSTPKSCNILLMSHQLINLDSDFIQN